MNTDALPQHLEQSARLSAELTEQIRPILAGQPAEAIGATLCELTATWLAGHVVPGDREATDGLRNDLFTLHMSVVLMMTDSEAKELGTTGDAPH